MDINTIFKQYDFNLEYSRQLAEDIPNEKMAEVPHPSLVNHPSFALGHIVLGSALLAKYLGGGFEIPKGWKSLFHRNGPGDLTLPDNNGKNYPDKKVILDELESQHERVKSLVQETDPDVLNSDYKWRFSDHLPTLLDLAAFLCINHEAMHLGQLAAWRRAMGMDSALAKL